MRRARLLVLFGLLTGCAGIIGIPDLTLEELPATNDAGPLDARADSAQADGHVVAPVDAAGTDARPETEAGLDAGEDAGADAGDAEAGSGCATPSLDADDKNCGFCGHDCHGAKCTAGLCEPTPLGALSGPFDAMVEYGDYVYVGLTRSDVGSRLYRVEKTPRNPIGAPAVFGKHNDVSGMVVLKDRLYFVVYEAKEDGNNNHGGLWSCPLATDDPCDNPTNHAAAFQPWGISTDGEYVYYADYSDGIFRFDPSMNSASQWRGNGAYSWPNIDGRGNDLFYLHLDYNGTVTNPLTLRYANAGDYVIADTYAGNNLVAGQLFGTKKALYFTGYEADDSAATGGLVRRVGRPSAGATVKTCSYGGDSNVGPSGLFIDPDRIYWTNRGTTNALAGSVDFCPLAESGDCCETPIRLWEGADRPNAVAADATWVYWATLNGEFKKVAK